MTNDLRSSVNRLAKWRVLFAGWQLGTRPKNDPECDAVRDHREATLLLRAELTALAWLLMKKGVITSGEFAHEVTTEADLLCMALEDRFPGVRATDAGLEVDTAETNAWSRGWRS